MSILIYSSLQIFKDKIYSIDRSFANLKDIPFENPTEENIVSGLEILLSKTNDVYLLLLLF